MCGIAGIIKYNHQPILEESLKSMGQSIAHRGPDASGFFIKDNVGLVHRRLSILDLSLSGNQPFYSSDGNYILIFNGEIFNFKEFYPELKAKGYSFSSSSDTEVLLFLLMEYGMKVLSRLNGFFAFAFYDLSKKEVFLARDRFGVKPLFYLENDQEFIFGSEPKVIFQAGTNKNINAEVLSELLFYRYVSGESTVFQSVKRILPGHYFSISTATNSKKVVRWFNLKNEALNHAPINDPLNWFQTTFDQSVAYRMIADVRVGTMLSGGLDSSSVLFSQSSQGYKDLSAWNVSISNYQFDESSLAKRFAESRDVLFNTFEFKGNELMSLIRQAIINNDEPLMHLQDGHLLGLSRKAKEEVSVLLSGEGADEIMGGYVRYKVHDKRLRYQLLQVLPFLPNSFVKADRWKKMKRYLSQGNENLQIMTNSNEHFLADFSQFGFSESDFRVSYKEKILQESKEIYPNNPLRQLLYFEQHTHLYTLNDRNDRTTMGASIECRDPFLDPNLVIGIASLGDDWFDTSGKGKKLLFESIGQKLPDYLRNHPKIGFSIPWDRYLLSREDFRESYEEIPRCKLFQMDPFDKIDIRKMMNRFEGGDKSFLPMIKQFFFLSLWFNIQFEGA
ncbi:MAG: asparagine synthase (glutamine-hydrolyzing) [Bacteroidota bacterium]